MAARPNKSFLNATVTLNKLLCCNVQSMSIDEVKKLVKKRHLEWHPDKNKENPELYREQWMDLYKSWKIYEENISDAGSSYSSFTAEDLKCDEDFSEFDFSDDDGSQYNDTPFSEEFFSPSPEKSFKIPETHRIYFRSKSNRRAGKTFAIYVLKKDNELFKPLFNHYMCLTKYFGVFNFDDMSVLAFTSLVEYRVTDIKKELKKCKIYKNEVVYTVNQVKFIDYLEQKYGTPYYEPCSEGKTNTSKPAVQPFNNNLLVDFAIFNDINNLYELMFEYAHLAEKCNYKNPSPEHTESHELHHLNAIAFSHLSDRKRAAANAINCVTAKYYHEIANEKPIDYINRRCKEIGDRLLDVDDCKIFGEAWYYCNYHVKKFKTISQLILNSFIYGYPRVRWTILQGEYKSGKTSFAAAFCKFFEGVSININCDKNRLSFFLGNAIGKRFVLFDDVKGRTSKKSLLTPGQGFQNLDDLRDYLDGHVEVQLEKKNQQPIQQVFPPGIITCNNYYIEPALIERVQGPIKFRFSKYWLSHEVDVTMDTIFIGCVIFNLLPAEPHVHAHITKMIHEWKEEHMETCDCLEEVGV